MKEGIITQKNEKKSPMATQESELNTKYSATVEQLLNEVEQEMDMKLCDTYNIELQNHETDAQSCRLFTDKANKAALKLLYSYSEEA